MSQKTFMDGSTGQGKAKPEPRPSLTIWPPRDLPDQPAEQPADEAEQDEPDCGPDYRVLSATGRVLGKFPRLSAAMAAFTSWGQAVAIICGATVIIERSALGRAA